MPFVQRNKTVRLHYAIDDFTNPWFDAPYMVLQHGMGRSSRLWFGWVPYLSRFYKIIRPDMRGCGRSSAISGRVRLEDYVGDVLAILDHAEAGAAHYCGDSFGGVIGMALAAMHPKRVRTLTLSSSPAFLDEHNIRGVSLGRPSWHAALKELKSAGWARALHDGILMPKDADPKMAAWFAQDMAESRLETLLEISRLAMSVDATPLLSRIKVPVLGLYPTRGTLTSNTQEKLLTAKIKNFRLVRFPAPYHMAQHIRPAASAKHLLHFAAQADGTTCDE